MWPFTRRRPQHVALRDFRDLTGFTSGAGFASTLSAASALRKHGGWLGIGVRPIVDRIAGLSWQALSDSGEEVEKSALLGLLDRPHPMISGAQLLRIVSQWLVMAGDAYLLKVRGSRSGRPVQLLPVSPDRVSRVWRDDGKLEYHVAPAKLGTPEIQQADEMVRIWRPLPSDPFEGFGAAAMLVAEIDAETGWREAVRHWFQNDSRPALALEFEGDFEGLLSSSSPGWESYVRDWAALQSRRDGALFSVPVPLPPNSKLRELSGVGQSENLTPTEQALRSKILSALGVPPFLLGAAHEANRASAEASLWAFDFSAVQPWAQIVVDCVNHALGADFPGQQVQFAPWIWQDVQVAAEVDRVLLDQCVLSPNEVRARRNLPPASWGELPVGQQQDQPYTGTPRTDPGTER